jgi:putative Ca2+/H+ antiporter (TMEM165/GDT1 family)
MVQSFLGVMLLALWAVLIAELVGDRSLYVLASLALRFRWYLVFVAFTLANAAKMALAVLLARAISQFQPHWTSLVSAIAFFVSAILIWMDETDEVGKGPHSQDNWIKAFFVSLGTFLLSEWGDPGQIAAAALVLKFNLPLAVWVGATLALMLKGGVAIALGLQIRHRLPMKTLRVLATASCVILGTVAVVQTAAAYDLPAWLHR